MEQPSLPAVRKVSRTATSINNAPWRWTSTRRPRFAEIEVKEVATRAPVRLSRDLHQVEKGETMALIAQRFGVSEEKLRALNGIGFGNPITGQVIKIDGILPARPSFKAKPRATGPQLPTDDDGYEIYRIQSGDNPSRIAKNFNVSSSDLMNLNEISNPRLLKIGQRDARSGILYTDRA